MAFLSCEFFSETLGICSSMNVIIPQKSSAGQIGVKESHGKELSPVLYLLHGFSDNHTIWMRRTSIERYASEAGLAVIMPAVNLSYYTNMKAGDKYWVFLSEELPEIVHSFFKLSSEREDTFVAGLSMGGYGAFKMAFSYPERFAAAGSFSGALDIHSLYENSEDEKIEKLRNCFGNIEDVNNSDNDLYYLATKLANRNRRSSKVQIPNLYQCCGTADFLYNDNLNFRDFLHSKKINLLYEEVFGQDHNWGFWDKSIERFISIISSSSRNS